MNTLELFSGTGSFSKVAKNKGYNIFRVEIDTNLQAELHKDILQIDIKEIPKDIYVLWASPPCTAFSVASIGHNWEKDRLIPKTSKGALGLAYVLKTLEIIRQVNPKYWFIENPRGMLRLFPFMKRLDRKTITYCRYGDNRQKPTDIWTNLSEWVPRPMCKKGDVCHISAPRGSKTGTQGLKNARERGIIPPALFEEILGFIENGNPHPLISHGTQTTLKEGFTIGNNDYSKGNNFRVMIPPQPYLNEK